MAKAYTNTNEVFAHYEDQMNRIFAERTAGDYTFFGILAEFLVSHRMTRNTTTWYGERVSLDGDVAEMIQVHVDRLKDAYDNDGYTDVTALGCLGAVLREYLALTEVHI